MDTAKRVYLYTASAVSLLVLSIGFYNLVAVALGELSDAFGASVIGGGAGTGREEGRRAIGPGLGGGAAGRVGGSWGRSALRR